MAAEKLVIVESPAKAKTINRFLGKGFKVVASMGHVRDLPETLLGIDLKNDFHPVYEESKRKSKILSDLRSIAKHADEIYLAPDPDREGEAIAWHLYEILKTVAPKAAFFRVSFHEITAGAIEKAFQSAGEINMNLVDAQQARRVLDRLVGYQVSPLLWSSVERGRGISAGRVQSVALRLVVERERIIRSFIPEEFWNLWVELEAEPRDSGKKFRARFVRTNNEKTEVRTQKEAETILNAVQGKNQKVILSDISPRAKYPSPPFITSTLQQIAGSVLRFSTKQTMQVAQELYEGIEIGGRGAGGLITYMRTDSVNVAAEAQKTCRDFISGSFGKDFIPAKAPVYRSKSSAQEAHEAIRPTDVTLTPDEARQWLSPAQHKLYTLIWKRFIASQMAPAAQRRTTIETQADGIPYIFRAVATETLFQGYLRVFGDEEKQARSDGLGDGEEDQMLPVQFLGELKVGGNCLAVEQGSEQKFTEPPARYSEATLVKELETNGIGRPSTYATIVNTIQERKYVSREKGKLIPTDLGFRVNDYLVSRLSELFQVGFTADMEAKLDLIEEGTVKWIDMLHEFYDGSFVGWLENAKHENAPPAENTRKMLQLFDAVQVWNPSKSSTGKRSYDDKRFIASIVKQFEKNGRITEKQWNTLLRLAVTYEDQLPGLSAFSESLQLQGTLDNIRAVLNPPEGSEAAKISSEVGALLSAFESVKFETPAPDPKKKRVFDSGKFVDSIRDQAQSGKPLSEKQLSALVRLAERYTAAHPALKAAVEAMGLESRPGTASKRETLTEEQIPVVKGMLEMLSKVETWNPPVKRGPRTFDDREFYASILLQFNETHSLSPRQVAALSKMAARYNAAPVETSSAESSSSAEPVEGNTNAVQTTAMIEKLLAVTDWEPGKGRFDDKRFFESLHRQYKTGKVLSEKQRDILFKMVQKYCPKN